MKSELQQEALSVLSEIWSLSPDARLGQIFDLLGFMGDIQVGHGLGYIEDDELLAVMYRHRAELLARIQGTLDQQLPPTSAAVSVSGSSTIAESATASVKAYQRTFKTNDRPAKVNVNQTGGV